MHQSSNETMCVFSSTRSCYVLFLLDRLILILLCSRSKKTDKTNAHLIITMRFLWISVCAKIRIETKSDEHETRADSSLSFAKLKVMCGLVPHLLTHTLIHSLSSSLVFSRSLSRTLLLLLACIFVFIPFFAFFSFIKNLIQ
jgi:hypothetical protein